MDVLNGVVAMTVLVVSFGLIPIATGASSEVQRPLATVVVGELVTSTVLTFFIIPIISSIFRREPADA